MKNKEFLDGLALVAADSKGDELAEKHAAFERLLVKLSARASANNNVSDTKPNARFRAFLEKPPRERTFIYPVPRTWVESLLANGTFCFMSGIGHGIFSHHRSDLGI